MPRATVAINDACIPIPMPIPSHLPFPPQNPNPKTNHQGQNAGKFQGPPIPSLLPQKNKSFQPSVFSTTAPPGSREKMAWKRKSLDCWRPVHTCCFFASATLCSKRSLAASTPPKMEVTKVETSPQKTCRTRVEKYVEAMRYDGVTRRAQLEPHAKTRKQQSLNQQQYIPHTAPSPIHVPAPAPAKSSISPPSQARDLRY